MLETSSAIAAAIDLPASAVVFGSSLFPAYAPTGRFLDRPLRLIVIGAAGLALAAAALADLGFAAAARTEGIAPIARLFLDTGVGEARLARLALSALVFAIALTLRRNSWTARPQARILALVAAGVLVCRSLIGAAPEAGAARLALGAVQHLAGAAVLGGFVPLVLVLRDAGSDAHQRVKAAAALRRFSVLAVAAGVLFVVSWLAR